MDVVYDVQDAVNELQKEIESLKEERDGLSSKVDDCGRLQNVVADLEAKLTEKQQQLNEQTALVCFTLVVCGVRNWGFVFHLSHILHISWELALFGNWTWQIHLLRFHPKTKVALSEVKYNH